MKKWILGIIAIWILTWSMQAGAVTKLEELCYYFDNGKATQVYQTGNFVVTNETLANGDIEQMNAFTPDGGSTEFSASGSKFWQGIQTLVIQNAVNLDAITNQGIQQTGIYFGPDVVSQVDLNQVNKT